jgi:hypothetical protein
MNETTVGRFCQPGVLHCKHLPNPFFSRSHAPRGNALLGRSASTKWNLPLHNGLRLAQGRGASGISVTTQSVVTRLYSPTEKNLAAGGPPRLTPWKQARKMQVLSSRTERKRNREYDLEEAPACRAGGGGCAHTLGHGVSTVPRRGASFPGRHPEPCAAVARFPLDFLSVPPY